MEVLTRTKSICPECYDVIDAEVVDENGKAVMNKECPKHGKFREVYWSDSKLYKWARGYAHDGRGVKNPAVTKDNPQCPYDCGLCKMHKSHTALANLFVTNRCELRCWYCFANVGKAKKVFEPDLKTLDFMMKALRDERPVPCKAIQITGGEPCVREDLIEIIKMAKKHGFAHVQLNTNGIRMGNDPDLAGKCREAGIDTVYMSFDGTTKETNPWLEENLRGIENCRKVGLGIVLVPCVINSVNDQEVPKILEFAAKNIDIIRGVDYQPVSFVGNMPAEQREKQRFTIPDLLDRFEEGTKGVVKKSDFYPIPAVTPVSHLAEQLSGNPELEFTPHFACGMATYIFVEDGKMIPITRFVDVEAFFKFIEDAAEELKKGGKLTKAKLMLKAVAKLNKIVDKGKAPKDLNLTKILIDIIRTRKYDALGVFHMKALFVGSMHFQDAYNYDIERVKRCVIHYVLPDGRIVPFCAFNGLPQLYLMKMQQDFGESIEEYEKRTGRRIEDDLYKK